MNIRSQSVASSLVCAAGSRPENMRCVPLTILLITISLLLLLLVCISPLIFPRCVKSVNRSTPPYLKYANSIAVYSKSIHQYFAAAVAGASSGSINIIIPVPSILNTERASTKSTKGTSAKLSVKRKGVSSVVQMEEDKTNGRLPPGAVLTRELYVAGHSRPHPELCPLLGARLRLVILVSSAPAHAAAREAVRLTWGHAAQRADVALGFVLGASPPQLRAALDREDALYGDLIEGRSVDSYSNLTLKTLSMLEWVDTYCPRAPRLLKTDDDVFVNVNRLLQFAKTSKRRNASNSVWGKLWRHSHPARARLSRYFVPLAQFPGKVFPVFAAGPAYLMTTDAARRILRGALSEPFLQLEDVFVTGVVAARLGVRRLHSNEFFTGKLPSNPCAVHHGVAFHKVRYYDQFDLWQKLFDGRINCNT